MKQILFRMFETPVMIISGLILLLSFERSTCHQASSESQTSGITREYYIAAVMKDWDYAPSGMNKAKQLKLMDDR
jgi:hypothetical protein